METHTHTFFAFSSKLIASINLVFISQEVRRCPFMVNILFYCTATFLALCISTREMGKHSSSLMRLSGEKGEMKILRRSLI